MRILPPFESVTLRNRRTRYLVNECYLSSEEQANRSYPISIPCCQTKLHGPPGVKSQEEQSRDQDDDVNEEVHVTPLFRPLPALPGASRLFRYRLHRTRK